MVDIVKEYTYEHSYKPITWLTPFYSSAATNRSLVALAVRITTPMFSYYWDSQHGTA